MGMADHKRSAIPIDNRPDSGYCVYIETETKGITMDFQDLIDTVNNTVDTFLADAQEVDSSALGFDGRSFYGKAFVTPEVLAVRAESDRSLQYYGGFEYVRKEHRIGMGDWVFYLAESDRVREHLAHVFEELNDYEDEDEDA